jgi:hypothetical protein
MLLWESVVMRECVTVTWQVMRECVTVTWQVMRECVTVTWQVHPGHPWPC